jgi:hypothetical protein
MSLSSTSSSKPTGWRRARRELLRLVIVLLVLELVVRFGPGHSILSSALDPYENLLWYSDIMPAYRQQLTNGPHYDMWLAGSSYMMTGWQPEWFQADLNAHGIQNLTVQNYGMTDIRQLGDMAQVFDRWMFRMDQPEYMVIGVSVFNASATGRAPITASPMERAIIFPESIDDLVNGWLYNASALYRYSLLARNATFIPLEEAALKPHPLGGYIPGDTPFENCNPDEWKPADFQQDRYPESLFAGLDRLIEVTQARGIPVVVVEIPLQYCNMRRFFASEETYQQNYLAPLTAHLQANRIPFFNMATRFYEEVPDEEQYLYFMDRHHPNSRGAEVFSAWAAEFVADWLKMQPTSLLPGSS